MLSGPLAEASYGFNQTLDVWEAGRGLSGVVIARLAEHGLSTEDRRATGHDEVSLFRGRAHRRHGMTMGTGRERIW